MTDREKVIKAIECCVLNNTRCFDDNDKLCPYFSTKVCMCEIELLKDALELLKEQKAQKFFVDEKGKITPLPIVFPNCPLKEQDAEKPKGHWMPYEPDKRGYTDGFTCSRCERVILSDHYCKMIDFDFCPYCGAYMDNAEGR